MGADLEPIRAPIPDEMVRRNRGPSGLRLVELEGTSVVVAETSNGFIGFQSRCPHAGARLIVAGHLRGDPVQLFCQKDGIYFSLETGEATVNHTGEPSGCLSLIRVERDGDDLLIYFGE